MPFNGRNQVVGAAVVQEVGVREVGQIVVAAVLQPIRPWEVGIVNGTAPCGNDEEPYHQANNPMRQARQTQNQQPARRAVLRSQVAQEVQ
jgi:hypothetical protein